MTTPPIYPNPRDPGSAGVSAVLALVISAGMLVALAVFGLGALSFFTDRDLIAVPGLGQGPGIIAMVFAILAFVIGVAVALRAVRPSFLSVPMIALTTALVHLVVVSFGALVSSGDMVIATVVAGDFVRGGASIVLAVAAAVAAWIGIALRRTRAEAPRWPWEKDELDEE